jgi:hypothetical protein
MAGSNADPEELKAHIANLAGSRRLQTKTNAVSASGVSSQSQRGGRGQRSSEAANAAPKSAAFEYGRSGSVAETAHAPTQQNLLQKCLAIIFTFFFHRIMWPVLRAPFRWGWSWGWGVIRLCLCVLSVLYVALYVIQQYDSSYDYPPELSIIWIQKGAFTYLIHAYACKLVCVQVPGFKICPAQPILSIWPSSSAGASVIDEDTKGNGAGQGRDWGPQGECMNWGVWASPEFKETKFMPDCCYGEGKSMADRRKLGLQKDIQDWEDLASSLKQLEDVRDYLGKKELREHNDTSGGGRNPLAEVQIPIQAMIVPTNNFIDVLRDIHSTSVAFEGVLVPVIEGVLSDLKTPPAGQKHPPWWKFWQWGGAAAEGQRKKEYAHSMKVLHGLLDLLQNQVSEASMRRRNLDSQEALVVDRAVRRHLEEESRIRRG